MRILHLLRDGRERIADEIIEVQSREHQVTVIDLSRRDVPYETVVDEIFAHDRVIAW